MMAFIFWTSSYYQPESRTVGLIFFFHFTPHHIRSRRLMSQHIRSRHITPRCVTTNLIILLYFTAGYITPHPITAHHITSCHLIWHQITPRQVTKHHITLHYITSLHTSRGFRDCIDLLITSHFILCSSPRIPGKSTCKLSKYMSENLAWKLMKVEGHDL